MTCQLTTNHVKVVGVGACAPRFAEENMRLPMVLTDRWTLLMAIVAIAGLLLAYFTRNKKEEEEEEQLQAAEA